MELLDAVLDVVLDVVLDTVVQAMVDATVDATVDAGGTGAPAAPVRWMAVLCGSVTTVIDRLFLPGRMYVSLTHTMPSSRLALTLDDVTDEQDEDMDATAMDSNCKRFSQHGFKHGFVSEFGN